MQFVNKNIVSPLQTETILFIEWNSFMEYYVYSNEDLKIFNWSSGTAPRESILAKSLPIKLSSYIVDIDCMNISQHNVGDLRKRSSEIFAIGSTDGKCHIIHKTGRVERVIEAHKGAVMTIKWNHDGTSLLTSGEDGSLKIWSRSGMLRSTHTQTDSPIYSAVWSPFSTCILYSSGKLMTIQPFSSANGKTLQWKAHDSVVLVVAWSAKSNLIASGSEDCLYKIWDPQGQLLFNSVPQLHPVNCISWSPDGSFCAFAAFSSLSVTNCYGSIQAQISMEGNGISSICWSQDGSQIAAGNKSGLIQISHLLKRDLSWKHFQLTITSPNSVIIKDILNDTTDVIEVKDDAALWSLNWGNLVAATQSQCFIYKENNWSNPISADLREKCPQFIKQCEKYFLVMDCGTLYVFSYDGSLLGTPKIGSQRLMNLTTDHVSSAKDIVAARSPTDGKVIHFSQLRLEKSVHAEKPLTHSCEVTKLELDPCSTTLDQILAFVDASRDLFLVSLSAGINKTRSKLKIASGVSSFRWNSSCSMLALIREQELCVIPYPPALFHDLSLMDKFAIRKNVREYGKYTSLHEFSVNQVVLRRSDELTVPIFISPYPCKLQEFAVNGQWDCAQRLCSSIKIEMLWMCLAAMAVHFKQLDAAQVAYVALRETDRILYIDSIKKLDNSTMVKAETALLQNGLPEAEAILLQAGLHFPAIMLNLQMFNFEKSLELAVRYDSNVDVVLAYRRKYLEQFGWMETNSRFIEIGKKVDIDWDGLEEKLNTIDGSLGIKASPDIQF